MSAIPAIPAAIVTHEQLDRWIDRAAPEADTMAKRMRLAVAVMDWAVARNRAASPKRSTPAPARAGAPASSSTGESQ